MAAEEVSSIIWATGYDLDFSWVEVPIFGERGVPRHRRGVTDVDGLHFLGLHWQHTQASGTLFGVAHDARYLADQMGLSASTAPLVEARD